MTTQQIFDELKSRIISVCNVRDCNTFKTSDLGFYIQDLNAGKSGGRLKDDLHSFSKINDSENSNEEITVRFWSYDKSGPFLNEPDINKFNLVWKKNNEVQDSYSNSYEDDY